MDPFSLIASLVPSIVGLFTGDEKDKETTQNVLDSAMSLFGIKDKDELAKKLTTLDTREVDMLRIRLENQFNLYKSEVDDRISARNREVSMKDTKGNALMYILALTVVVVNLILLYLAFERPDTLNNPGVMALAGCHTSALTLVLSYFFGSSLAGHRSIGVK